MSFKLALKGFKLKKLVVEPKKRLNQLNRVRNRSTASSTNQGPGRPTTQPVDTRVNP